MPIVFVHGVANRPGEEFTAAAEKREVFLRETVAKEILGNTRAEIFQPMWGYLVPVLPENNRIIPPVDPSNDALALGAVREFPTDFSAVVIGPEPDKDQVVLTVARRSFTEAIDLLWDDALSLGDVLRSEDHESELIAAGVRAGDYAEANPEPEWVREVADDPEFIEKLLEELEKWNRPTAPKREPTETFGAPSRLLGWLRQAGDRFRRKAVDVPTDALLSRWRPSFTQGMIRFFGDVFFYQTARGTAMNPGGIIQTILTDLQKARHLADTQNEKLIVIGHSMGGNILYDILTYFDTQMEVDAFVTVGSQASLFKQLQLFCIQQGNLKTAPEDKLYRPPGVRRWLNIFDPQDLLSFAFEPEFEDVRDYYFESPGGVLGAHGDYFKRVRFYERLVARLRG